MLLKASNMKTFFLAVIVTILSSCGSVKETTKINQIVNASCGICNFNMTGDECDLAIEIDGKYYYTVGSGIDEHGDSHAADGFCNAIRKAEVVGEIKHGVFYIESFKVLPE